MFAITVLYSLNIPTINQDIIYTFINYGTLSIN